MKVVEQLSKDEQRIIMYAIRQFGTGGHPLPDERNVISFTPKYTLQCLRRTLKNATLDDSEREKITSIVMKLNQQSA
jgi:hypothetical protein